MEPDNQETKNILVTSNSYQSDRSKICHAKPKKERVVTDTRSWTKYVTKKNSLSEENIQRSYLGDKDHPPSPILVNHIMTKLRGYKYQDQLKGIYQESDFVNYAYVIECLQKCDIRCFYCHCCCMLIYNYVREPRQWTLERIDNNLGHNKNNVQIACLECNLRRRTIHHERYIETKKLVFIRKLDDKGNIIPSDSCHIESSVSK